MGQEARKLVIKEYSWKKIAETYESLYKDLLGLSRKDVVFSDQSANSGLA